MTPCFANFFRSLYPLLSLQLVSVHLLLNLLHATSPPLASPPFPSLSILLIAPLQLITNPPNLKCIVIQGYRQSDYTLFCFVGCPVVRHGLRNCKRAASWLERDYLCCKSWLYSFAAIDHCEVEHIVCIGTLQTQNCLEGHLNMCHAP